MTTSDDVAEGAASSRYRIYVLVMLLVVYTFAYIDRQILGILAPAIKAELHLSDSQLGLMGGLAFAVLYTGLGIPIGWMADRWNRTWIITAALTIWSSFTALSGLAGSFLQLFVCRMGVGLGEAGGVSPSYSVITDYFPPGSRARALAAYSFGVPIGGATGTLFGGLIASHIDWRMAFLCVGLAGLCIAPVFRLTVKEPKRTAKAAPVALGPALGKVARTPSFWGLALGTACASIVNTGVAFWMPSFFTRSLHFTLPQVAMSLSAIILVGGLSGCWAGGWLADRLSRYSRRAYTLVPACAFLTAIPFYAGAALSHNPIVTIILLVPPQALVLMWLGPVLTAVQHIAPPAMRATAASAYLLISNLSGLAVGTFFYGAVSDLLTPRYGQEALRYALLAGLGFYVVSAAIFYATSRRIDKDWIA